MYNWRKLTDTQRKDVLRLRKTNKLPWHSPPHRCGSGSQYHITASCYEHKPIIGYSEYRMADLEATILDLLAKSGAKMYSWAILPNHYHLLIKSNEILQILKEIGLMHGRTSRLWNKEENNVGRKVWYNVVEHAIKSNRHFWATMNYIHNNPVRHGYVRKWEEWPFASASIYLEKIGKERARTIWNEYPILDYGKEWDPPEM